MSLSRKLRNGGGSGVLGFSILCSSARHPSCGSLAQAVSCSLGNSHLSDEVPEL